MDVGLRLPLYSERCRDASLNAKGGVVCTAIACRMNLIGDRLRLNAKAMREHDDDELADAIALEAMDGPGSCALHVATWPERYEVPARQRDPHDDGALSYHAMAELLGFTSSERPRQLVRDACKTARATIEAAPGCESSIDWLGEHEPDGEGCRRTAPSRPNRS